MRRRSFIARSGAVTALCVSVAGCSGGGNGGDGGSDSDGGSGDDDDSGGGGTSYDGILRSDVDGLEVTSGGYTDTGIQGRFPVTITVNNAGTEETDVEEYDYDYTVYDSGRSDVTGGTSAAADQNTIAPGESTDVLLTAIVDGDPGAVTGYEIVLSCTSLSGGVYCEGETSE
jgi:hypothetical protein